MKRIEIKMTEGDYQRFIALGAQAGVIDPGVLMTGLLSSHLLTRRFFNANQDCWQEYVDWITNAPHTVGELDREA